MPAFFSRSTLWRWLIIGHRWLGVTTCLFFAMWFASGLVMMYVAFPELTTKERLSRLEPIDWSAVRITPERVIYGLALGEYPRELRLEMMAGEPVYRVNAAGWPPQTLHATTGRLIENIDADQARTIAEHAAHARARSVETIDRDQWSVAETFERHRPLHRVTLEDETGLELYVSSRTGEIMLDTSARERRWNWAGAVLHWLYFTELRARLAVWSQVVLWTAGIGIVVAATGLWLGIDRLRIKRRNGAKSITPFRGWMAWHHVAGVIGGVFVLTWIFSGWMSMGPPVPWERPFDPRLRAEAVAALAGYTEPEFPARIDTLRSLSGARMCEASFMWALAQPQIVLTDCEQRRTVVDAQTGAGKSIGEGRLKALAPQLMANAQLSSIERLNQEDAYWYSRRGTRQLPVLRFKFDDPDQTWMHVDPQTGRLVGWSRRTDRINRWLFNALHSFDFRWLFTHRPAWDLLLWGLSLAGLTVSTTSLVIAWRAIRR